MSDLLQKLLDADAPNVQKNLPEKEVEVLRLSELLGEKAIFHLRALPYGRVQDIREMKESEQEVQILLAGCVEPNLKDAALMAHFDAVTPVDTVRALLLPGEVGDLSREVEKLSGYRRKTIEAVKND